MFNPPTGRRYVRFLRDLHTSLLFDWYMEIGCRTGRSFGPVRGKTIAVDPFFRLKTDPIGEKPALHVFQQTSDDFFQSGFLDKMGIRVAFSFIDGMHLIDYVLRDFVNTERVSDPKGVIAIHDCCPSSFEMTTRDLDDLPKGAWTGDVWKIIPILQTYRPDLVLDVLPLGPSGLLLVSNLNPDNRTLEGAMPDIMRDWQDLELEAYGAERFYQSFEYRNPKAVIEAGYPMFSGVALQQDAQTVPEWVSP